MRSHTLLVLSLVMMLASCSTSGNRVSEQILHEQFASPGDRQVSLNSLMGKQGLVLFFYSPDCPLCINYTRTLKELNQEFGSGLFGFAAVFPDTFHTETEVVSFMNDYGVAIPVIFDTSKEVCAAAGASVTPEAVVISPNGEVLYQGAIDNWAYAEGKKRPAATKHYLKDALHALSHGQMPEPSQTQATGCIIE